MPLGKLVGWSWSARRRRPRNTDLGVADLGGGELCRDEALVEVGRRQRRCTLVRDGAPLCPPDSTSALKVHVLPALAPRGSPSSCPSPSPDAVMAVLTNSDDPLPVALRHPNIVDVGHPLRLLDHMLLVQLCSLTSCGNGSLSPPPSPSLSQADRRESPAGEWRRGSFLGRVGKGI
jgi:hypothetical protein